MDAVILGLSLLLEFDNIMLITFGVLIGVLVGALPGLSSPMAIALLTPFTIQLEPIPAIAMLAALYCAGTFGGSITAILINAPGAPPSVATALDGYPMAKTRRAWPGTWLSNGCIGLRRGTEPHRFYLCSTSSCLCRPSIQAARVFRSCHFLHCQCWHQ